MGGELHLALVELQKLGKLEFLISQNVDNLHLKSGIDPELLLELHGNIAKVRCSRCEKTFGYSLNRKSCTCAGALFPSVVNFGQSLPEKDLFLSFEHSRRCDLFVVIGSSLVVTPAVNMPVEALRAGAKLVIVNAGATPLDRDAHLRFHEKIGEVLPPVVEKLRTSMQMIRIS